jgi:PAS domain S-box-containing protein
MENSQTNVAQPPRRRLLIHGESLVAATGLAITGILVLAMAACAWWMLVNNREAHENWQQGEITTVGKVLTPGIESMLADNDLSAVRRLVLNVRKYYDLQQCRIMLPGGQVIADADPTKITLKTLPEKWAAGPLEAPAAAANGGPIIYRQYLLVPGRGGATLELVAPVQSAAAAQWRLAGGIGAIAAAGLACLWIIYRRTRSQLMPLGLIREALLAIRNGETVKEALAIGGKLSPEAVAWNELIAEMAKLQQQATAEQAKEMLGARRESRSDLVNACDALPHGVIVLDDQAHVRYANGAAAIFLQCKREALIGGDIASFIQRDDIREAVQAAQSGNARQRKTIEIDRQEEQGHSVFRFGVRPLRRDNGSTVLITIEDITQQCVAKSSRNSFIAQATHELRTPLSNIRLYVETAQNEGEKDPVMRAKCLNVINDESRRLERMVGEMLSVSEIEAGSLKIHNDDVRLDKMFEELEADYKAQAKDKKITLQFNMPPKLPVIHADRDRLILAVHNLIGNAMKYTPSGGQVTVAVRSEGQQLLVDVSDTGIGIDEQEQQLVFDKFYRSKDPRVGKITGSGLGLALAREVVRLHGGDITLKSELNKGSTFTLSLPTLKEAA